MHIEVTRASVEEVTPLRELYRREMSCQIIHDSFARRGFTDPYLVRVEGRAAGYGLVAHKHYPETVIEFHTLPEYRRSAQPLFRELLEASQAKEIRAQTNSRLMLLMLYDCAVEITAEAVLFEDGGATHLASPGGVVRPLDDADRERLQEQKRDADAHLAVEYEGELVALGGVLHHYNPPYGDLYMEVHPDYRRRGFGSYLIQELRRIAYETGKIPAARCNATNLASRRTLQRGGMLPCGRMLSGKVVR